MTGKRAIVFLAWGYEHICRVEACIKKSQGIHGYDLVLVTDTDTDLESVQSLFVRIIRASFATRGLLRKAELLKFLPEQYCTYLYLDSDTVVLEDIDLGFEKAEEFAIAVAPAPHYSLDYFWGFDRIMELEDMPCKGQLQYNTGVIFFNNSELVKSVFQRWMHLVIKYQELCKNDQPFFSLAMEELNFNPYTLSIYTIIVGLGMLSAGLCAFGILMVKSLRT